MKTQLTYLSVDFHNWESRYVRKQCVFVFFFSHALALADKTSSFKFLPGRDYENLLGIYICSREGGGHTHMGPADVLALFSIDTPFAAQGMNRDEQ